MKRVTLVVSEISEADGDGDCEVSWPTGARGALPRWLPGDQVVSIEDHVEPLPTTPGERFWGKAHGADPQWWFVQRIALAESPSALCYIPADQTRTEQGDVNASMADRLGLVRLSDPEPTS